MEQKRIGLNNGGNNCFFNSVLQSIHDCTVLNKYILSNDVSGEFVEIYKNFLNEYYTTEYHHINPSIITRYVSSKLGRLCNTQEDADVYLSYIIDVLIDELQKHAKQNNLVYWSISSKNILLKEFISSLFNIEMTKTIQCHECKYSSNSNENNNQLYLTIDKSDNLMDIISDNCYDYLTDDNKYQCEKCNKLVNATIKKSFKSVPKYLFITLKRYNNSNHKVEKPIDMPETINIDIKTNRVYNLRGIIYHMGSTRGGHYVYYGKKDNNIKLCNDSSISDVSQTEFNSVKRNGYIYLYVATHI